MAATPTLSIPSVVTALDPLRCPSPAGLAATILRTPSCRHVAPAPPGVTIFWPVAPGGMHAFLPRPPRIVLLPHAPAAAARPGRPAHLLDWDPAQDAELAKAVHGFARDLRPAMPRTLSCRRGREAAGIGALSAESTDWPALAQAPDTPQLVSALLDVLWLRGWAADAVEAERRWAAPERYNPEQIQTFLVSLKRRRPTAPHTEGVLTGSVRATGGAFAWPLRLDPLARRLMHSALARWRASAPDWFLGVGKAILEIDLPMARPTAHEVLDAAARLGELARAHPSRERTQKRTRAP